MSAKGHLAERSDEEINSMMSGMEDRFRFDLAVIEESARRNGGKIPQWLFESLPRVCPQSCIELAVLRKNPSNPNVIEILMKQRPETDIHWAGELHMAGTTTYMFDGEQGDRGEALWSRLERETGLANLSEDSTTFITLHFTTHETRERGPCMHAVVAIEAPHGFEPSKGEWYNVGEPPDHTIDHHMHMIAKIIPHLDQVISFG